MSDPTLVKAAKADPGVWFEGFGKIWPKDRKRGLVSPRMNYLQRLIAAVVARFEELGLPIRVIGLKPRQKGSTTMFAALDYYYLRKRSSSCCVIGGQYDQTSSLWDMLQTYQENDRCPWGNTGTINEANGKWSHGSQLRKETANDRLAGVSDTFQILHCTEVARWSKYGVSDAATVLTNIKKCVPLLPDTIISEESTAEGNSGSFYENFVSAVDAEDFISGAVKIKPGGVVRLFAAWFQFDDSAIRLTKGDKEEVERTLDADSEYEGEKKLIETYGVRGADGVLRLGTAVTDFDVWEQLYWRRYAIHEECKKDKAIFDRDYPHSWQDAFLKSGNMRFNQAGVNALRKRQGERAAMYGIIEEAGGRMAFRPTEPNEAKVILYERPTPGKRYIEVIDPMTGASQVSGADPDEHSVFVLRDGFWDGERRWNRIGAVARLIPNRWDIDVVAEESWKLAKFFGDSQGCKIVVEMNKDAGITENLKDKTADLYQREVFNQREFKTTKSYGFLTSPTNRESWVESTARGLREWNTPGEGLDLWDEHAIVQCENFIRKENGSSAAGEGFHDDDISAIGIGLLLIDHATTYFPNRGGGDLPPDLQGLVRPQGPGPSQYS